MRITRIKILAGILSLLGITANGQDGLSDSVDESQQVQQHEIDMDGGRLTLSGKYHGSVGITYDVECDSTAFVLRREKRYKSPWKVKARMRGGDDSTVTVTLIPQKRGVFEVYEVSGFRGTETKRVKHIITVK